MFFSVVIPLYNKSKSISRTIQSVLDQIHQDFELIIVNDGSTDNSIEIVQQVSRSTGQQVRIINQSNSGVSKARNNGVKAAKYEYIAFLDADDWWEKTYLYEINKLINDFPGCPIYGTSFNIHENNTVKSVKSILPGNFRGSIENYSEFIFNSIQQYRRDKSIQNHLLFNNSSVIISKEKLLSLNGFNPDLKVMEDWDMFLRAGSKSRVAFLNQALSNYNREAENRATDVTNRKLSEYACFNEKVFEYFKDDKYASYFWNFVALAELRKFYFSGRKDESEKIIERLNLRGQPFKFKVFYKLPYPLAVSIHSLLKLLHSLKK